MASNKNDTEKLPDNKIQKNGYKCVLVIKWMDEYILRAQQQRDDWNREINTSYDNIDNAEGNLDSNDVENEKLNNPNKKTSVEVLIKRMHHIYNRDSHMKNKVKDYISGVNGK